MRDQSKMENKMRKITIVNKSKIPLQGLEPGGERQIEVDKYGTPKDRYWRKRKADATTDGCIEIVKKETKKIQKKEDKI